MNQNSLDAYALIKSSGLLTLRTSEICDVICRTGAMTQHEVITYYRGVHPKVNQTSYTSRFGGMVKMDMLEIVGTKVNPNTGRLCDLYNLTGRTPNKLLKELTINERYNIALDFMLSKDILMDFSVLVDNATKEKNK